MRYAVLFVAVAISIAACTIEGPTTPSKTPLLFKGHTVTGCNEIVGDINTDGCGEDATTKGGKACVLTPADYSGPTCHYTCPNGSTYDVPSVDNYCVRVAPYPKKGV